MKIYLIQTIRDFPAYNEEWSIKIYLHQQHNLMNLNLQTSLSLWFMYHSTKYKVELQQQTKEDTVRKIEDCMIHLHYYLEKADVRMVYFISRM